MIVAINIIILAIGIKLMWNYYGLWLKRKPVNHTVEWCLMALACIYSIIVFAKHSTLYWVWGGILSAIIIADFIWFFFNGLYNTLRGYGWWFTGSGGKDGAITDMFLKRLKTWQQKVLEIVPLAISIIIYLKYYKHG